jgi:hypothetical protein
MWLENRLGSLTPINPALAHINGLINEKLWRFLSKQDQFLRKPTVAFFGKG